MGKEEIKLPDRSLSLDFNLNKTTKKYIEESSACQLTPETLTAYQQASLDYYGNNVIIRNIITDLTNKEGRVVVNGSVQEIKLDTHVKPFPDNTEAIREHELWGMEPLYIHNQTTGPKGIEIMKQMYGGKIIDFYNIPPIENKITKGGWRYVQVEAMSKENINHLKKQFSSETIQPIDLPAYIALAVHTNNLWHNMNAEEKSANDRFPDLGHNSVCSLGGSYIKRLSVDDKSRHEIPGAYFSRSGSLNIIPLSGNERLLNLATRFQMPIKSKKIA